jgi:DnaK suppressor protein
MRTERLAEYRAMLEGQLAELLGHGEATVHEMAAPGDELTDPNDRATRESDTISELRMRDRDRKLIAKVQEALGRIEDGTFGTCESCGRSISAARLRARPVTTLCIDCKREAELRERA